MARVTAVTAGRPSGIEATASATAVSRRLGEVLAPEQTDATTTAATMQPGQRGEAVGEVVELALQRGLVGAPSRSIPAMRPISVPMPVAVTTSSPRPRVTVVCMWAIEVRSAMPASSCSSTASCDLATGRLSPVSAASSISSCTASTSRPSAGIRSPASTATTSPGTSVGRRARVRSSPSRRTRTSSDQHLRAARRAMPRPGSPARSRSRRSRPPRPSTTMGVLSSPDTTKLTAAATTRISDQQVAELAGQPPPRRVPGRLVELVLAVGPSAASTSVASRPWRVDGELRRRRPPASGGTPRRRNGWGKSVMEHLGSRRAVAIPKVSPAHRGGPPSRAEGRTDDRATAPRCRGYSPSPAQATPCDSDAITRWNREPRTPRPGAREARGPVRLRREGPGSGSRQRTHCGGRRRPPPWAFRPN